MRRFPGLLPCPPPHISYLVPRTLYLRPAFAPTARLGYNRYKQPCDLAAQVLCIPAGWPIGFSTLKESPLPTRISLICDKLMEAGWLAAVVFTPLYFNVYSSRVFEPDKISFLRNIVCMMTLAWMIKADRASLAAAPGRAEHRRPPPARAGRGGRAQQRAAGLPARPPARADGPAHPDLRRRLYLHQHPAGLYRAPDQPVRLLPAAPGPAQPERLYPARR